VNRVGWLRTWRAGVHDQGHTHQTHDSTGDIPPVGTEAVDHHPPEQRAGHEDTAVRGQDAAEVRVRLQGGHEAVQAEADHPRADPDPAAVLADPLPDQPGAADLSQGGEYEQTDRAQGVHALGA
jgi:hypothetical protein